MPPIFNVSKGIPLILENQRKTNLIVFYSIGVYCMSNLIVGYNNVLRERKTCISFKSVSYSVRNKEYNKVREKKLILNNISLSKRESNSLLSYVTNA